MEETTARAMKPTKPFRYAVGMFGTSIPVNMFKTYAAFFYVDHLGLLTTPQFSRILFLYTFLDAIDNPVYGFLSDRTRSKWGRRRPWLLIGAPLLVLCFIMFFNPPAALQPGSAFSYILLMYMLTGTLDSLINANYGALFPELFPSEKMRAKTNAIRQVFQLLAMIISIALTPIITEKIGFASTAFIYGALAVAVIWFMTLGCHENPAAMESTKPPLFRTILDVISNPKFWIYGVTNAAFFAGLGLVQSGVPFYVKYHLNEGGVGATVLLGTVIISAILFIPLWVKIISRIRLMPAWRIAFAVCVAGVIPLYFTGTLIPAAISAVLLGFGFGGVSATMDVVSARILDEDKKKTGLMREGSYTSLIGILNKTSGLFTSLAFLLVYQIYGFESGTVPGDRPDEASRFITVLFPVCVLALCLLISAFLHFEQDKIKPEAVGTDSAVQTKKE